uniref:Putative secreted protein n=1 Tax=Anopheles darlingi TaxID=43151 RepID=A0A2M4DLX4_ANODA
MSSPFVSLAASALRSATGDTYSMNSFISCAQQGLSPKSPKYSASISVILPNSCSLLYRFSIIRLFSSSRARYGPRNFFGCASMMSHKNS